MTIFSWKCPRVAPSEHLKAHLFDECHCYFSKDLGFGFGIVWNYAKICSIRTHSEESKDAISWVRRF